MTNFINFTLQNAITSLFEEEGRFNPEKFAHITVLCVGVLTAFYFYMRDIRVAINGRQFTTLPADFLSKNSRLSRLDLSQNQLTTLPADFLSKNPRLSVVNLSRNQLTALPADFLSKNPRLSLVYLSENQLNTLPDNFLFKNPRLSTVSLSYNQLTALPDNFLFKNPRLSTVFLSYNQLTALPANFLSQNPQLHTVDLSHNRLTALPANFLSQNPQLHSVYLSHNRLTALPANFLSQNPQLHTVDLSDNRLTTLPDSILNWPKFCSVTATNNLFSSEYVHNFEQRVIRHRRQHPGQGPRVYLSIADDLSESAEKPLKEQINTWETEYTKASSPSYNSLLLLDAESQKILSKYLRRLRDVKDYKAGEASRKQIVTRVHKMLDLAERNVEFRNAMFGLILEGTETCGDRISITFNDIEVLSQFHENQLTPEEYKNLCLRAARYEEVKKFAKKIYKKERLVDEIQTILYFQLALKESLNLPISTEDMLYPGMSGVTPDMIKEAIQEIGSLSEEQLLARSDYWQAYMRKGHGESVEEINSRYTDLLAELEEYFKNYVNSKAEQGSYLDEHPTLKAFLARAEAQGFPFEYTAMAKFLGREREAEISRLS
jgi:Leucine-rich repeat (LRR) protein